MNNAIIVETKIKSPLEKVWKIWNDPKHIVQWYNASEDWHTPKAENDLKPGGKFSYRMEAKDGSAGFDFEGRYDQVVEHRLITFTLNDDRKVKIEFSTDASGTTVVETFEAEDTNSHKLQRDGWQAILDNFKMHVETSAKPVKIQFKIVINAPSEKVYKTMIDKQHYKEWTKEFNPTSDFEGSWEKGAKILFIGIDEKGNKGGMVSRIKENILNKYISIEHIGLFENGKEITSGLEVEGWAGALENYTFTEDNGKTVLSVDTDSNNEYKNYFEEIWPKALNKLKSICENNIN